MKNFLNWPIVVGKIALFWPKRPFWAILDQISVQKWSKKFFKIFFGRFEKFREKNIFVNFGVIFGHVFGRVSSRFRGRIGGAQRGRRVHVCGRLNSEAEQADAVSRMPSHVDQRKGRDKAQRTDQITVNANG